MGESEHPAAEPSFGLKRFSDDGLLREGGYALVLGRGMSDGIFLAERGYVVDAVGRVMALRGKRQGGLCINFYNVEIVSFLVPSGVYDLIAANDALRSIEDKEAIAREVRKMAEGLVPGGLLYFTLFGSRDEWVGRSGMSFFGWDEALALTAGLSLKTHYSAIEEVYEKSPLSGDIYHQIFHFLYVKE